MALVCISFSQLVIQLASKSIHFHESCHSFECFKRRHCPMLDCVSSSLSRCCQVFCLATQCSKGSWKFTYAIEIAFVSVTFELVLWLHYLQYSRTLFWVSCRRCGIHHGPPSTRLFLSTSYHHLGISLRNKKIVPWDLYASMTYPLTFDIGSHHWPLIERFN